MERRQHYLTLDALRGVAAFAVMIYHQQQTRVMGHGYLAVDFFFILSGFVIAKAYERKLLTDMRFSHFALVRIARLYPLLIAATLLSTAYMVMSSVRRGEDLEWLQLLPAALLALPDPSGTFAPDPFPLLPVVWSLFFELFANLLYAARPEWLSTRKLTILVASNGLLLAFALAHHGNGEVGNTYATLWAGVPRVLFSFLAGVLFFRLHADGRLVSPAVSPLALAAVLLAVLAVPHDMPWLYDAICIFVIFPLVLIAAMNNEPAPRWKSVARFSADVSYPLYLFHLPLILWLGFGLTHLGVSVPPQHLLQWIAVPALAYAAYIFFDRPVQVIWKARLVRMAPRAMPVSDARAL
ncbi:MAG TPA: acyltransferase [Chthoniobacterales bacterium]|nr:acyltransferase [Chthoniobacterales bacterium]